MTFPKYIFAGWIPTVVGRLSFRHVGDTNHPSPTKYANIYLGMGRVVVSYQRRDLSDMYFKPVVHWFLKKRGNFHFVLICSHDHADKPLTGFVYVYKTDSDWLDGASFVVTEVISNLNSIQQEYNYENRRKLEILTKIEEIEGCCKKTCDFRIQIQINRNGEVFFAEPLFSDPKLYSNSEDYFSNLGINFDKWLVDQTYFFIRDVSHEHQHHDNDIDTILITQELNKGNSWRRNILFSLYHFIIKQKRNHTTNELQNITGIISYAETYYRIASTFTQMPRFYSAQLRNSIESKAKENYENISHRQFTRTTTVAVGAAAFATLSIFTSIFAPEISKSISNSFLVKLILKLKEFTPEKYKFNEFDFVVLLLFMIWIFMIKSKNIDIIINNASMSKCYLRVIGSILSILLFYFALLFYELFTG